MLRGTWACLCLCCAGEAQSSEQTVEEAIFQSRVLLTNEIEKRSKDEVLALGAAVLHARGQDWMREKLSRVTTAELARKLAASAGIPIRVAGSLKPKDALVEELMELFASATAACFCMGIFCSLLKWFYRVCCGAWVCLCFWFCSG